MMDEGFLQVPIGVSARHVHICRDDAVRLFGGEPTLDRELTQPGEFAAKERVNLCTAAGMIPNVRILGPCRGRTQVELSRTDCFTLGIPAVIRLSGNLEGTPGLTIVGPRGSISLADGVIVAARHLHITTAEARRHRLEKGMRVKAVVGGERGGSLHEVIVRPGDRMRLELHLDTDEANAFNVQTGDTARIIKPADNTREVRHTYICVDDIRELIRQEQRLHLREDQKLTPAARELALKHNLLS